VKRFSQRERKMSFKIDSVISKQSQKRHVRGRGLRERAKEREIENAYTSVLIRPLFSSSFLLFLLLEKFNSCGS
jgi:hypothetical protein